MRWVQHYEQHHSLNDNEHTGEETKSRLTLLHSSSPLQRLNPRQLPKNYAAPFACLPSQLAPFAAHLIYMSRISRADSTLFCLFWSTSVLGQAGTTYHIRLYTVR